MSFFGSRQVSFAEAFPEIEELSIEITVRESASGFTRKDIRTCSLASPPPATIACTGKCSEGKHDIEKALRQAVAKGGGVVDEGSMCRGREAMGRDQSRSCTGGFYITGTMKLKESPKSAVVN